MAKQLARVFKYNGNEMSDPNPNLSPKEVMEIYSNQHPELLNANVKGPEIKEGKAIYEFSKQIGTKG